MSILHYIVEYCKKSASQLLDWYAPLTQLESISKGNENKITSINRSNEKIAHSSVVIFAEHIERFESRDFNFREGGEGVTKSLKLNSKNELFFLKK